MVDYCIPESTSLLEALTRLNNLRRVSMTLFVVDSRGRMTGSLTDGDIRRALIGGAGLCSPVSVAQFRKFAYITDLSDIRRLKSLRESGIKLVPVLSGEMQLLDVIDFTERKTSLPVDAVLMAGGKGLRLRPLTLDRPKPLLEIGGQAIIDRNVNELIANGVRNVSVTVNYLKEQLIGHYRTPVTPDVKVNCVEEEEFLGTIGALTLVKEFHNDTILVMNSDLITDIDFEDFYIHFREHDAMMSAAAVPYTVTIPYGIFELDGRDIKGVSEKPIYNLYANAGIYLLKKQALEYIPQGKVFNATDLIDTLVVSGQRVIRYPLTGLWIDVGTPEEFRRASELVKHLKS